MFVYISKRSIVTWFNFYFILENIRPNIYNKYNVRLVTLTGQAKNTNMYKYYCRPIKPHPKMNYFMGDQELIISVWVLFAIHPIFFTILKKFKLFKHGFKKILYKFCNVKGTHCQLYYYYIEHSYH